MSNQPSQLPNHGYELAFDARQAAHPEVNVVAISKPMTFQEYATLYNLGLNTNPPEPYGSMIDEFAVHFLQSVHRAIVAPFDEDDNTSDYWKEVIAKLERVSFLVGGQTFATWTQEFGHPNSWNISVWYQDYVLEEACVHAWSAHVAEGAPYGPIPRHWKLYNNPRLGYQTRNQPPRELPRVLEAPVERAASAEEIGDICPHCRVPIEPGDTLMILPCNVPVAHWFHPECITEWFTHRGGQECVYFCAQRLAPLPPVVEPEVITADLVPEHNNYDFSFTFQGNMPGWPDFWYDGMN